MRIDLFKSPTLRKDAPCRSAKVETRAFVLEESLDNLDEYVKKYVPVYDNDSYKMYKASLLEALQCGREYEHIGLAGNDSLSELEKLGLGQGSYGNVCIIDFSECFDFIMHLLTGCAMEKINSLPDYKGISYAIMNNDFSSVEFPTFGKLMDLDSHIADYFNHVYEEYASESSDLSATDFLIYRFYSDVMNITESVKSYIFLAVQKAVKQQYKIATFVQRSKTFSSLIISCDREINEEIEIVSKDGVSCKVEMVTFKKYAYITRVGFV